MTGVPFRGAWSESLTGIGLQGNAFRKNNRR